MIYREYYKELGNLLYAIAKADGQINKKEIETLKSLVRSELKAFDKSTDEFGSDLAFFTEFEFEQEDDRTEKAEDAYESFITFVKANEERINDKLRQLAVRMANKIAEVFRDKNKPELIMLKKLKKDLGFHEPLKPKRRKKIYN